MKQVLDWLEKHGEVFLRKNIGIGRNLTKARVYQKSHETFEGVVQVRFQYWLSFLNYGFKECSDVSTTKIVFTSLPKNMSLSVLLVFKNGF